ncbi:hypothetical protein ACIPVK_19600 [Paeniglutamicibacter sp. MACA_103]|uniref:hypothetical protein n=1 Tax=Paeniglutamicibacter sp. MACA_103 TaxID=3377337 RepID=UPI0038943D4F
MEQHNGAAVFPDPDRAPGKELMGRFRRLARSSPWLWNTIQIRIGVNDKERHELAFAAPSQPKHLTVLVRRPDAIRVEDENGTVLFRTEHINDSRDAGFVAATRKSWLLPPQLLAPVYGDDGLVSRRPEASYGNELMPVGLWGAFLDPVEIAGFAPGPADMSFPHPSTIHALRELRDEAGRECLEAELSRGHSYAPVNRDAPLLGPGLTRVRLDRATGICVLHRVLDGPDAGLEHRVSITAVDEYMIDGLFTQPRASLSDVRRAPLWPIPGLADYPGPPAPDHARHRGGPAA